jgi:hypothetical protein
MLDAAGEAPAMLSMTRSTYSMFEAAAGELDTARAAADDAIALARTTHNPSAVAMALYASGWATAIDDPARARQVFEESIALFHAGACDAVYIASLSRLAPLLLLDGDVEGALVALDESIRYTYDDGDRATLVYAIDIAARVFAILGRDEEAAVFAGISEAGVVARLGALLGAERSLRTQALDDTKARLGEAVFSAAFRAGMAMSYEEAVDYSLAALARARAGSDTQSDG